MITKDGVGVAAIDKEAFSEELAIHKPSDLSIFSAAKHLGRVGGHDELKPRKSPSESV